MKNKKSILLIFGLIMMTQMIYAQTPYYVPTNGLVGYWPFNGNANDESGNGNNGTVNGATLTTDRFGNANAAYNFDGVNDNILVQMDSTLAPSGKQNYTYSLWFQGNPGDGVLMQIFTGTSGTNISNYDLGYDGSKVNFNHFPFINNTTSPDTTARYVWTNILVSVNQVDDTVKFYKNGIYWYKGQISSLEPSAGLISIGAVINNLAAFEGKIDDIGIWNRALNQQEITNMYNGVNYSSTCNSVSGSLVNGLVGYWPFCGNANDQSGNGNNGTVNGATLTTDRFGDSNSAYNFDGINDLIKINTIGSSTFDNNFSISAWCSFSAFNNDYLHLIYGENNFITLNGNGPFYAGEANKISAYQGPILTPSIRRIPYFSTNTTLMDSAYYHIVFIKNGTTAFLYLNGILESSISVDNSLPIPIGNYIQIGSGFNNTSNYCMNGKIDDIGIWNRALTQQEVTQLYNQNQCITNITVTDTLIINVGQLSYTNPVVYANNITIYPNPANTQVNINFNNITDLTGGNIKIINSLGQQVATTPITSSGTTTTMQLNTWGGTGLYYVQMLNAQGIIVDVKKIILQ